MTREKGVTRPDGAPKECERGRAEVLGTFSARARRECKEQCGECDCGRHALQGWEASVFRQRDAPQRPVHKKGRDTRLLLYTAPAPHPVCSAHTYTCATARRDLSDSGAVLLMGTAPSASQCAVSLFLVSSLFPFKMFLINCPVGQRLLRPELH